MSPVRLLVPLALGLAQGACAATSGQEWLSTPLDAEDATRARAGSERSAPLASELTLSDAGSAAAPARPRLARTITLGGSDAGVAGPAVAVAAPSPGAAVQVNVNVRTEVPVMVNGYGYGFGAPQLVEAAPARSARGAVLSPGQDFPSPPSYGPPFPYRTAPASPWAR